MIYTGLNHTGEVQAIHTHGGGTVGAVYGGINYQNPIFYSRKTLTGTSPLTFKGLGQQLKDYRIFGETIQNGTPSPDYPVDVVGCGERTGNLWDGYLEIGGLNGGSGEEYNPDTHYYVRTNYLPLVKSDYSTVCVKVNGVYIRNIFMYNENKIRIATVSSGYFDNGSGCVFSLSNACRYIRMCFQSDDKPRRTAEGNLPEINVDNVNQLMINAGDTPIGYEPPGYKIPITVGNVTTPIYIGSDPLYRIGDYADEIGSDGTLTRRNDIIDILADTSKLSYVGWFRKGTSYEYRCFRFQRITGVRRGASNCFRTYNTYYDGLRGPGEVTFLYADSYFAINFSVPLHIDTVEKCIQWLTDIYESTGKKPVFVCPISTPTAEQATAQSLPTLVGDNTLSVGTTVKPSAVSVTGNIKPTGYGQLVDVNDVDIQDSTGEPVYIQG